MAAFSSLVRTLDDSMRARLDGLAKRRGYPGSADVSALADAVRALSSLYNRIEPRGGKPEGVAPEARVPVAEAARRHLSARLSFSFPRDVPKGASAVRELVGTGLLTLGETPLRVLDFGAGLGAMTAGLARALEASGARGTLAATLVDADEAALSLAADLARATAEDPVVIEARTAKLRAGEKPPRGPFDVILVGQVLSELDEAAPEEARVVTHLALLESLYAELSPTGSLVVIEPALRDRSRHLHALRDAWVQKGRAVFAPCLHVRPCPALAREGDWCHEDLAVDLPSWLVPVAKAAGLRWEGLSSSYLVLRRDDRTLAGERPEAKLRVVSELLRTKGKTEAFVCGKDTGTEKKRLRRLDRHASESNVAWDALTRGSLLSLEPQPDGERIEPDCTVRLLDEESR